MGAPLLHCFSFAGVLLCVLFAEQDLAQATVAAAAKKITGQQMQRRRDMYSSKNRRGNDHQRCPTCYCA